MIDGIRVIRHGSRNLFNYAVLPRYRSQFRHEAYDVVVDDMNKIPFFTPLFVREPLVGIVHHLFGNSIFAEASLPAALYVAATERLALRLYRRIPIAVVSESTKQEMVGNGFPIDMLPIVPNAIDHRLYRQLPIERDGGPIIGYLGRIKKYKSVDHLLTAFAIVRREFPTARLIIVGDGDARAGLEQLAREEGIANSVVFTGYVTPEEKVRWLNRMDVVVNTSAKEGWGLTVIEANACGAPVVASDVPGLRDSVLDGQTGLLYEYGDIEQLAEKVSLVLRDEHFRSRLSTEALGWAATFTWEHSADLMEQVLEKARA
jgi:glycosyltransferase involved in cell wall biosynthesis